MNDTLNRVADALRARGFDAAVFSALAAGVDAASCAAVVPTPNAAAPIPPAVKVPKKARRVEFRFIFQSPLRLFSFSKEE